MDSRRAPIVAVVVAVASGNAMAAPPPRTPSVLYPRIERARGAQTIVLSINNTSGRPLRVCTNPRHCLRFEVKNADGTWTSGDLASDAPVDHAPADTDFTTVPADALRDVLRVRVARVGATRDFKIGDARVVPSLPPYTEYRFTYELDPDAKRTAARLKGVVTGPLTSGAGPMILWTPDRDEIVAAIPRPGERPGTNSPELHVQPGDAAILPMLEPLVASSDFTTASLAIKAVAQTDLAQAVALLERGLSRQTNFQLRGEIAEALHELGAKVSLDTWKRVLAAYPEEWIVLRAAVALGDLGDPAAIPLLAKLRGTVPDGGVPRHLDPRFTVDRALARLGDPAATRRVIDALAVRGEDRDDLLRELPYVKSVPVAKAIAKLLAATDKGSRVKPYVHGRAPTTAAQRAAIARFERDAYVRIADDAAFAIARMFPAAIKGFDPSPLRRYTPAELEAVARAVAAM